MKEIKTINLNEFREKGYLQELNRRFLHPLGLSLMLTSNGSKMSLDSISDSRSDNEGIYFDIAKSGKERKKRFLKNKNFIDEELKKRLVLRKELLGFEIEPIEDGELE